MVRRIAVIVFGVLAPLASVLAMPAAAQDEAQAEWPQYSRDDASGCDETRYEDGSFDLSCDDGSFGSEAADGSGYWQDGASGCFSEWDTEGNVFYDSCAEGDSLGDDGGEPAGVYDEATGCWVNDFGDGTIEQNCDDGSWGTSWSDGSGFWYTAATACFQQWDADGAVVEEWCDEGGDEGGEPAGTYDEATGCWTNSWDGGEEWNCDDGSRGSRYDDGSSSEYDPATGCEVWRNADGSENAWCDDGSNWYVDSEGNRSESTYDEATGCMTETQWDGSIQTRCEVYDEATGCNISSYDDGRQDAWCDDGSSWSLDSEGNRSESTYDEATGCTVSVSADGSESGWCDDGSNWYVDSEGNRSESTYDEATGCMT
ncbi:MAG: hypothetical protein CL441_01570, partial [Acidimicrobiaceae bacterium]|nr:hypothetical protein [Acidimicrobiaceae bacterium]